MNLDIAFGLYLMSHMTLKLFVLRNVVEFFASIFFLLLSNFGLFSVETGKNPFPVIYELFFVIVFYLINGFWL